MHRRKRKKNSNGTDWLIRELWLWKDRRDSALASAFRDSLTTYLCSACWGDSGRAGDVGAHAEGFLEDGLKKLSLRDLGILRFPLRFRIQQKMGDRLRVGETIMAAEIVDVVFDRLPQKHLHLDHPFISGFIMTDMFGSMQEIMSWRRLKCLNDVNAGVRLCKATTNGVWEFGTSTA